MSLARSLQVYRRLAKPASIWAAVLSLLCYLGIHFLISQDPDLTWNRVFAYNRLALATALAGEGSDWVPEWLKVVCAIDDESLLESANDFYDAGVERDEIPNDSLPPWALLYAQLGENKRANEVLDQIDSKALAKPEEFPLITAIITGSEADGEIVNWAWTEYQNGEASWVALHYLAYIQGDTHLIAWFDGVGKKLVLRGIFADAIWLVAFFLCTGFLIWFLFRGRRTPRYPAVSNLPKKWDTWAVLLVFFSSLCAAELAAYFIYSVSWPPEVFYYAAFAAFGIFVSLPVICLSGRFTPGWKSVLKLFGLREDGRVLNTKRLIAIGLAGAGFLMISNFIVTGLFTKLFYTAPEDWLSADSLDSSFRMISDTAYTVVIAPIVEEIVFRGFLFSALRNRFGVVAGLIVSSAIFATIHWYTPAGTALIFFDGAVFCWLFLRTRSLLPGMIAHGMLNFTITIPVIFWYSVL